MTAPSARQLQVLREIRRYQDAKGFPISVRELCDVLAIRSTNGVAAHLKALNKKGLLFRQAKTARSLLLTDLGRRVVAQGNFP